MAKKWTKIADSKVQMVWRCPVCEATVIVNPTFYEDAGTPICTSKNLSCDGNDMKYVRTEILKQS